MGFAGVVMYGVYSVLLNQGLLLFLPHHHSQLQTPDHMFFILPLAVLGFNSVTKLQVNVDQINSILLLDNY